MKTIHDILKLGNPRLYENCEPVSREELPQVMDWMQQLNKALEDIRRSPAKAVPTNRLT
jgi:peptide deformylase